MMNCAYYAEELIKVAILGDCEEKRVKLTGGVLLQDNAPTHTSSCYGCCS